MNIADTPVSISIVPQAGGVCPLIEMQAGSGAQSGRSAARVSLM